VGTTNWQRGVGPVKVQITEEGKEESRERTKKTGLISHEESETEQRKAVETETDTERKADKERKRHRERRDGDTGSAFLLSHCHSKAKRFWALSTLKSICTFAGARSSSRRSLYIWSLDYLSEPLRC
jgi:hypothetical protein